MKVGIITFNNAKNYGAILQAYGLQEKIRELNCDVNIIDYKCPKFEKMYKLLIIKNRSVKNIIKQILELPIKSEKYRKFKNFEDNFLTVTKHQYRSKKELEYINDEYDAFITGSDQVWSYVCADFDENYFLTFVKDNKKKNSYAASFGMNSLIEEYKEAYKERLSGFNNIAVRESKGVEFVRELLNRESKLVVDPTLLIERNKWEKMAIAPKQKEKYILVYSLYELDKLNECVMKLKDKTKLNVITIQTSLKKKPYGGKVIANAGPEEFVGLIKNAEVVITNSYHGMLFSIIFNKEFFVIPNVENATSNVRMQNVLELLSIEDRFVNEIDVNKIENINYDNVSKKLKILRDDSIEYLKGIIKC